MTLRVSGKNVDIGEALRGHVVGRIGEAVDKYTDRGFSGHVTIEREGSGFRTECMIHLDTGVVLQTSAMAFDPHQSADQAADKIEKRLRRYKRKLKDKKGGESAAEVINYTVFATPDEEEEVAEDFAPAVIAETQKNVKTLTVAMAVMELDLTGAPVLVFRNAGNGGVNVIYRRSDGNIGWIDPALTAAASA
ncbi:MAG: ribosome-associated translation inhibitor RaiA [Hyphomicrobiaceae bacterium]|nr:ribosome-associated translation inhibitor RaiA [Hyphomicrobiaceae bacterium]